MPKLGEVQPKAQARRGGETVNGSRSCNGSQRASSPAPPPPHLRRRHHHPGRPQLPRTAAMSIPGSQDSIVGSRVTGQHVRAGHHSHSPTNKCALSLISFALSPLDGWSTQLTFSLFAFACLFIPSPRPSIPSPPSIKSCSPTKS
jgi:hypothetical protein